MSRIPKRVPLVIVAVMLILNSGCSSSPTEATPVVNAEQAVVSRDAAEVAAFLANDPVAMAELWSNDFVVTNPFNQFLTKQQVIALATSGTLAFTGYERHIDYTHSYGNLVAVAGSETVVWSGKIPLAGQTSRLRYTSLWQLEGKVWKEVARQASFVQAS